jgi:hypothetical protein
MSDDEQPKQPTLWRSLPDSEFLKDVKKYGKSNPVELTHMLANSRKFLEALNNHIPICNITSGFIHNEPKGIKAMDQSGPTKGKLKQMRLYLYPEIEVRTAHFICIGDKKTQQKDIKYAEKYVSKLLKQTNK